MKPFLLCAVASLVHGQSAFDVVSVKPHPLPAGQVFFRFSGSGQLQVRGNTYTANFTTLAWLLMDAYDVKEHQIEGLPEWTQGAQPDRFDVLAKSETVPTATRLREMLRQLLADRFQMKLHRESKEIPVLALVVDRSGLKMRKLADDEKVPTYASRPPATPTIIGPFSGVVDLIRRFVDRPIVDHTGLTGNYEHARLDFERYGREMRGAPAEGPSIFTALQQELGLRLEPRKELTDILVIDHVEKPSAN